MLAKLPKEPVVISANAVFWRPARNRPPITRSSGLNAKDFQAAAGYYGERLVLLAQNLGLSSCWLGMTHGKSRPVEELCELKGAVPDWFRTDMAAA